MKYRLTSGGGYTPAKGVMIQIREDHGTFNTVGEACDFIKKVCNENPKAIEIADFRIEELPTKSSPK